jgi:hypothetical protein
LGDFRGGYGGAISNSALVFVVGIGLGVGGPRIEIHLVCLAIALAEGSGGRIQKGRLEESLGGDGEETD